MQFGPNHKKANFLNEGGRDEEEGERERESKWV